MFESSAISVVIYLIYPLLIVSVGVYVSITKEMTLENYYFADRKTYWIVLGTSLLTSSLFGPYLFGLAYSDNLPALPVIYGLVSVGMLLLLGWKFAPIFLKKNISTLPEYFENRFNKSCKYLLSSLYVLANIFFRLFIVLVAGNVVISMVAGIDPYFTMIFFLLVTAIFIIIGGLQAEMFVNVIQISIIAVVLIGLIFWILNHGTELSSASRDIVFLPSSESINGTDYSMAELVFGLPILGFWFWTADQFIVQKLLSAGSKQSIRKASVFASIMQIFPVLLFILPAILTIIFFQQANSAEIFNLLLNAEILPEFLRGGIIIAVSATIIAAISSLFNTTSMLLVFDFYKSFKPKATGRELVLIGRLIVILFLFGAILMLPSTQSMNFNTCLNLLEYFSFFVAHISAVFLAGLISKNISAVSAFITLTLGTIFVLLRILVSLYMNGIESIPTYLHWFSHTGFLEFTIIVFLFSTALIHGLDFLIPSEVFESKNKILRNFYLKMKLIRGLHKSVFIIFSLLIVIIVWWIN